MTFLKTFLFALSFTLLFSCTDDEACADITCLNDGECQSGSCECILGYEGDVCETEAKLKFLGFYIKDTDPCEDFESSFEIVEVENSLTDLILIIESNNGGTFEVDVSLDSADSYVTGSGAIRGVYSNGIITSSFGTCEATYIKQ